MTGLAESENKMASRSQMANKSKIKRWLLDLVPVKMEQADSIVSLPPVTSKNTKQNMKGNNTGRTLKGKSTGRVGEGNQNSKGQ